MSMNNGDKIKDEIREIRISLRLAMNGVISSSMRDKGMHYKLNFGVPLLEVKQIASRYHPDSELATALWKEDIREFKLLAPLLQPVNQYTRDAALSWISEIPYPEIAEQCSRYLFSELPDAYPLAIYLFNRSDLKYARFVAFLIFTYGLANRKFPEKNQISILKEESLKTLSDPETYSWTERHAVIPALRYYGRQSPKHAEEVLDWISSFSKSGQAELREIYNELKFEFEYYH